MKLNKYFLIVVLIFIILLSTFYSEGMSAYVMKNAFINDSGAGRLTTIDTDGNFSNVVSDVNTSVQNITNTTTPISITTKPNTTNPNTNISNDSSKGFSINIDSNALNNIESEIVNYINNHPDIVNKIEQVFSPQTTLPQTTLPQTTLPQTTLPQTTLPQTTLPQTTKPK